MKTARALCASASAARIDGLPAVASATAASPSEIEALAVAGAPVLLSGLVDHWPAVAAGRGSPSALNLYLKALDQGSPVPVMEAPAASGGRFGYGADLRDFSFTKRQRPLGETLDRIERASGMAEAPVIAIQMLVLAERLPGFLRHNPMPLLPADAEPRLWLGGPVKTQIHNDPDHNLACVIAGRRRFLLFPPEQVANLYIGPPDRPPPLSLVDPEAPDLERFPRFAEALRAAQVADLGPGDALLLPKYWWHHVISRDRYNAMVNYWWGSAPRGLENAHDCFLAALLAIRSLPTAERLYWRAMFETHVFDETGEGAAHIPPALRAYLGDMSPRERAALRRQLELAMLKPVASRPT